MSTPTLYDFNKESPLRAPPPTLGEILSGALVSGFKVGVACSVAVAAFAYALGVFRGESPNFLNVAGLAGWFLLITFVLGFFYGILSRSRPLANSAFTVTGFLATFFGLGMLVIFFGGLLIDVAGWFYWTPTLVEMKNEETVLVREELKQTKTLRDNKKAEIDKELKEALEAAENDADKKEISKLYLGEPEEVKVLEKLEEQSLAGAKNDDERKALRQQYDVKVRAVGGVYAEALRNLDTNIADRRKLADMPLRETSVWAVVMHFLFGTPSNEPEAVGIKPALFGSLWLAVIMILFAVPVGVGAALYLEEYKTTGRLAQIIQTNINNLAGVPSIVYGILGAFVFVELIFKPLHLAYDAISVRNVIGAGMTLGLLTLPVVIVSAQEAIRAVPSSIRHGAYALGATHWQTIWQQVLPLARPGIMTGTILAVSRAIGEAAPLVLFGATTFIAYTPNPITEFTVLPIQIYNWAERTTDPRIGGEVIPMWHYNMAMASLVLLIMLLMLNGMAIYLRNKAQQRVRV